MDDRFQTFTLLILSLNRSIQRIKKMEMKHFGLQGSHVMCLFFLSVFKEGLTVTNLSKLCDIDKAAISRSLQQLSSENYINTPSKDKYKAVVTLTEKGYEVASEILEKVSKAVEAGGSKIDNDERTVFYSVLKTIASNLENYCDAKEK